MKVKIKNIGSATQGFYAKAELVFIDAGNTQTVEGVDPDELAKNDKFVVQSSADGKDWKDHSPVSLDEGKPWAALASTDKGDNLTPIDLAGGKWYIGFAMATDRPDGPAGYEWSKLGGSATPVVDTSEADKRADEAEAALKSALEELNILKEANRQPPNPSFDAATLVDSTAAVVIERLPALTPNELNAVLEAEQAREGGPRKGVTKAIDEALKG